MTASPSPPTDPPRDRQLAATRLPAGFELWVVRPRPDDVTLAESLSRRLRGAHRLAEEASAAWGEGLAGAAPAPSRVVARLDPAAVEQALAEATGAPGLVVAADEGRGGALVAAFLGVPASHEAALRLDAGRASCLVASSHGWLLAHHNVADPGGLERRPEGLGRPA